uniref:berbamunine synthase-like n=1 Tax=Erigeron canadensis TaxID=72917 RepID=UPI001CB8F590|nr:berbamunine synthase-like [Erigeron canadensis]
MAKVHGPLMSLRAGQKLIIVGSSATVAAEILKTHDKALSSRDLSRYIACARQGTSRQLGNVWKDSLEKKRRNNNGRDISSSLIDFGNTLIEKGFGDHQINIVLQEIFSAGTESTSAVIEFFIVELIRNEEVMHKVVDEVTKQIDGNI